MIENINLFLTNNPFIELGIITLVLVLFWVLAKYLKQPVLVWYIMWWVVMSPSVADMIHHHENIKLFAEFGITLLLFIVWLWLNPRIIKEVGKVATIVWIWQVLFTSVVGFWIIYLLGFDVVASLYIAVALTFSSTIVIVKLISDRWDTATVYWKIALGMLIVQDMVAMIVLIVISTTMMEIESSIWRFIAITITKLLWLWLFVRFMSKYVISKILKKLSHTSEIMLLFTITRAILLGWFWYYLWYSVEIGALLAWVSLANSQYRFHIASELRPLRDFFVALFFVYLWSQVMFDSVLTQLPIIIALSLFVLIGNPMIVMALMWYLGYTKKNGFMTWLTVAQISEFSFIVIALAIKAWHITDPWILSMVTVIWLITMMGSSYFFAYADKLYAILGNSLSIFERKDLLQQSEKNSSWYQTIFIGYSRIAKYILNRVKTSHEKIMVIDFDPIRISQAKTNWFKTRYWDINNHDILTEELWKNTQIVCSTIADYDTNRNIIQIVKSTNKFIKVVCVANYPDEAQELYFYWADFVVVPHHTWAESLRTAMQQYSGDLIDVLKSK